MSRPTTAPQARFSAQARLRALQADIMDLILDRDLDAGDPLPTESELSEVLGVGRNTLRESLKVLQALGVIEIRHGFGMFVAPRSFEALADGLVFRSRLSLRHEGLEALQLVDIRQALEAGLIGTALTRIDNDHLKRLGAVVDRMEEQARRGEAFFDADAEFHAMLFEPLGNELLMSLMSVFWQVYRKILLEVGVVGVDLDDVAAQHRALLAAIAAKDAGRAVELLGCHFDNARAQIRLFVDSV